MGTDAGRGAWPRRDACSGSARIAEQAWQRGVERGAWGVGAPSALLQQQRTRSLACVRPGSLRPPVSLQFLIRNNKEIFSWEPRILQAHFPINSLLKIEIVHLLLIAIVDSLYFYL